MQKLYSSFENDGEADLSSFSKPLKLEETDKIFQYTGYIDPINKSLENEITQPLFKDNSVSSGGMIPSDSGGERQQPVVASLEENQSVKMSETEILRDALLQFLDRLPNTQFSNYLLKIYFDKEYPIYPILNKVETYANFFQLFELKMQLVKNRNFEISAATIMISLTNLYFANLICSLATSNIESTLKKEFIISHQFYNRDFYLSSVYKLSKLVFDGLSTIQKLQSLICMGQIALCRPCFPGLWNISALISSIVVKRGLYDDSVYTDDSHCDMQRRCFWAAYLLDRYVCLCLTKPHLIDEASISVKYFSTTEDEVIYHEMRNPENCKRGPKQYSIFYIRYFRLMSEIDNTIYSAHTVKILEETGMNTEELTAYLERLRTKMQNKLDNLRTEVDNFVSQVLNTNEFNAGYLSLLYYQAICLLYKPRKGYSEPSIENYKRLCNATEKIILLFKKMSDKNQLTYRILSISSLFFASVIYNCCVWKCENIAIAIEIDKLKELYQVSKTVFGRIRNFYNVDNEHTRRVNNIVNCCSSVLSKFNTALCEYVRKVQSPSVDNPEFSDLGMDIADEKFLFGGGLDFGSPFGVFESLENIPWEKNMK
ncbi:MAG: fungal transcription factor regulatory middle homology region domain-containing protein [Leuconostoc mesenteroides]